MFAGAGAIVLWGALATLSVIAGPVPAFQMVAMTFAIGAALGIVRARRRGLGWRDLVRWPAPVWLTGVGGLFGYHALYFAALQLAPPAEANLINYLWPLLIVLLSAPLAGERLGWPHLVARAGFPGCRSCWRSAAASTSPAATCWHALALGCAVVWSLYSVLSRRFGETPTTRSPPSAPPPRSAGLSPAVRAYRLARLAGRLARSAGARHQPDRRRLLSLDFAVKQGDIRALGAASYATPILSTGLLILCGLAQPTSTLLIAALLVTVGAVLASREMWKR